MVFDPSDNSGWQSKQGHVLAVKRSECNCLGDNFAMWEVYFSTTFSPASIRSMQYINDKVLTFPVSPFVIQQGGQLTPDTLHQPPDNGQGKPENKQSVANLVCHSSHPLTHPP